MAWRRRAVASERLPVATICIAVMSTAVIGCFCWGHACAWLQVNFGPPPSAALTSADRPLEVGLLRGTDGSVPIASGANYAGGDAAAAVLATACTVAATGLVLGAASSLRRNAVARSQRRGPRSGGCGVVQMASMCDVQSLDQDGQEEEDIECSAPEPAAGDLEAAASPDGVVTRREMVAGAGAAAVGAAAKPADAKRVEFPSTWVQYDLNTGETLYDIDFDPLDPSHGFIVGARGLFYETKDGGKRWVSRSFKNLDKQGVKYRFQTVAVRGQDVWVVGKPPLLLHSKDAGASWKKVPLSKKLPGEPKVLIALGEGEAEMATSSGAVYMSKNDGKNWTSKVQETVDATLNRVSSSGVQGASYFTGSVKSIKRDSSGAYIAVAQRGNFYLTFTPGEPNWVPHNRTSARRIQAMGYRYAANGEESPGVWMTLNGGILNNCTDKKYNDINANASELFQQATIKSGGIGLIDINYRTPMEGWAVGGSGVIYTTQDGGKTWSFDKSGDDLPCNLYSVKFFEQGRVGYCVGSQGILLRREFEMATA